VANPKISAHMDDIWVEYKKNPTVELRNQLMEAYMPIVKFNGEKIRARFPNEVELDDLISSGYFGLMDAIESFDITRGVKFETYCIQRIQGAMLDEIRNLDWVPRLIRSRASKLNDVTHKLELRLGRTPTNEEIAEVMQITPAEVEKLKKETTTVGLVSLNNKWANESDDKDLNEGDVLEDRKTEDPINSLQRKDLIRLITKGLSQNERLILIPYYYGEMTMKEIGATLNLSESRVSQMHSQMMKRLKKQLLPRRNELLPST